MSEQIQFPNRVTNGLALVSTHTCPCGAEFVVRKAAAVYCSNACRLKYGQYGRTYGQRAPRELGVRR